ncbi:MAG: Txe/YoeB family addiction module toxin [Succinivibrio sp.]|nr:Txe/YoeB family addiction module toxin [Succinivibrio sp.]
MVLTKDALKDLKKLRSSNLSKKAKEIVDKLEVDPFCKPFESLKFDLSGMYSKRINIQHRIVYTVDRLPIEIDGLSYEGTVKILSMWTHYERQR